MLASDKKLKDNPEDYKLITKGKTIIDKLFLIVRCEGDEKLHKNTFLEDGGFERNNKPFYCDRDLTEMQVKDIVLAMIKSEDSVYKGSNKEKLFFKSNCKLP